jgi:hypothetical protein
MSNGDLQIFRLHLSRKVTEMDITGIIIDLVENATVVTRSTAYFDQYAKFLSSTHSIRYLETTQHVSSRDTHSD